MWQFVWLVKPNHRAVKMGPEADCWHLSNPRSWNSVAFQPALYHAEPERCIVPVPAYSGGSYSKSFHFMGRRKGSIRRITSPFWKIRTVPLDSLTATATDLVARVIAAAAQCRA